MSLLDFFWYLEELFLLVSAGFMILQGYRDETFGIPLAALIINLSWSFWFSFYVDTVYLVDQMYFFLHLVMLFQTIVFGHKEFFGGQRIPLYGLLVVGTIPCLGLMRALIDEEGQKWCHNQLFYGCMFVTAILFVHMLLSRGDSRGQHMMAAVFRCAGMLCGWLYQHPSVISWLGLGTLVADVAYIYLLYLSMEQPQMFHEWRSFLMSISQDETHAGSLLGKTNSGVVYHPTPMTDDGGVNKNGMEMHSGV